MRRSELEHVIRAAAAITNEYEIVDTQPVWSGPVDICAPRPSALTAGARMIMSGPRTRARATKCPTTDIPIAHRDPHPRRVPGAPTIKRNLLRPARLVAVGLRVEIQGGVLPSVHGG